MKAGLQAVQAHAFHRGTIFKILLLAEATAATFSRHQVSCLDGASYKKWEITDRFFFTVLFSLNKNRASLDRILQSPKR